jgi:LmbE family N-acetylglucosaminyl deacetylase
VLFVFAHPDDESFSGAGTAMKCAAAGARIVLVTATLGERGKTGDPPVCAPGELAACRRRELREATTIIGFDEVRLLGFRDKELADAPPEHIRRTLAAIIRHEKPLVVLTFDPNGYNRHPDHIAISRFTSDAVAAAADPRFDAEAGGPHIVPRLLWTPLVAPWDVPADATMGDQPGADFAIDVAAFRERRAAALRAHRSQHLSIDRFFFNRSDCDRILGTEIWRQGFGPDLARRPADDLFESLIPERSSRIPHPES